MRHEVPGASGPLEIIERMRKAQDISPERAREEGAAIAQEVLKEIKGMVEGVQVSPPLGKYELALQVLQVL